MFWADEITQKIIDSGKYQPYHVDDMKTPSGRVHVGALMGVVIHDLVYKSLKGKGVDATYTYVFENHDPMDDIPTYLPRKVYEKYLGMPLFAIPSPVSGFENFAAYYADDFMKTFNAIGSYPKILWTKDLYTSGKMNPGIKKVLDNVEDVRKIYQEMYKKDLAKDWYPFQVYCQQCKKVSTTRAYNWDGEYVYYKCFVDVTDWTKGCGYESKTSPFSNEDGMKGKMPWKVEWAAKWQAIGVTVEGGGKDHMSRGGSHDLASEVAKRVLDYPVPYPVGYEFMLIGGKKMSSSKGRGFAASDILSILPPVLARFLITKMDITKQSNFDPTESETIPKLFDDYQKAADAYFGKTDNDLSRIFELSQIGKIQKPPAVRFKTLAQWVQMPNMQTTIKKEGLKEWAYHAKIWLEKYAPNSERFSLQENLPEQTNQLSDAQRKFLKKVAGAISGISDAEEFQAKLFNLAKEADISSKDAFAAIYLALLGKNHGPKAGWLILSLDKKFIKKRFEETANHSETKQPDKALSFIVYSKIKQNIFSIDKIVKKEYPSISVGIAVIKGVTIKKTNQNLEKAKQEVLLSLDSLTTEKINEYLEIQSYRKLYKKMEIDWHSRRPSPEALLRRIALKKGLHSINTCVDAYNLVVMKHRISVGAFDLDKISFPTVLRFPKPGEEILLLGDQESTNYKEKELAYFDRNGGYNIDFNYRDARRTAVQITTKNLYLNVDGMYSITSSQVELVLKEVCDILIRYCGGKLEEFGVVSA